MVRELTFPDPLVKQYLNICLDELTRVRERILTINKELRTAAQENPFGQFVKKLYQTVPGIGFTSAMTLFTEIIDMKRFSNVEKLASCVGLVYSISASGQTEKIRGLTVRKNKYQRYLLIESSWIAIKQDEALFKYYCNLSKRMNKKRAIISVARKLLNRIRHVWLTSEEYKTGFIK